MTEVDYRGMLGSAKADLIRLQSELGEAITKQDECEKQIVKIREVVIVLSKMLGEQFVEEDALGLTDAIRQAFKTAEKQLTPLDIRERLEQLGYDTDKYGNVMASIHTVIRRLADNGEIVEAGRTPNDKPRYVWKRKGK